MGDGFVAIFNIKFCVTQTIFSEIWIEWFVCPSTNPCNRTFKTPQTVRIVRIERSQRM